MQQVPVTENTLPPVIDVELYDDSGILPDVQETRGNLQEMLDLLEEHYGIKPSSTQLPIPIANTSAVFRESTPSGSAITITSRILTGHSGSTPTPECFRAMTAIRCTST